MPNANDLTYEKTGTASQPENKLMSETEITKGPVPMGQKIAFGFGMLANQMFPAALGVFLVVLVQDLGFPPLAWGFIFFAPRAFDAITDPIMGFISDNTKSRWGRRRQYVFLGSLILAVSYIAMWQLYRENGLYFNFIYFMVCSLVFYLGLTIFSVPYVAMGYEMSDDFHERTSIMAVAQFIGQWAWVIAPWFWVILYDPAWFPNADTGVRQLSIWVGIACGLLAMIPAIFIRDQSTLDRDDLKPIHINSIKSSLGDIAKSTLDAFSIAPFRKLALATFLVFNSFNVIAQFTFFIIVHHLFNGDTGKAGVWPAMHGCIGALATTFLVIPLVAATSKKLGKKQTFILSQAISIIGYILFWFLFVPGKPSWFLWALPFHSFGIGGLFTLMMSMTADVCDLDEFNTGKRREGTLGAVYWWMVKFGHAFAGLLGGLIMWFVGFDPGNVTESSLTGLRIFYSFLPIAGVVGAILIMSRYEITESSAHEIRVELERRRAEAATASE
ncbi:MFS transporter [Rubripirellula sp.]|nr:MFS transporter [Rubripirellula sp.]